MLNGHNIIYHSEIAFFHSKHIRGVYTSEGDAL